ncbi:MAG: serpin family protein [Lachnospiraceae bacterium]|nr:serpin family protein [Lachnospiraceae bacterium]
MKNRKKTYLTGIMIAFLAVIVTATAILLPKGTSLPSSAFAIAKAAYPESAQFPDEMNYVDENGNYDYETFEKDMEVWYEERRNQRRTENYTDSVKQYYVKTMRQFLSGQDKESNTVCSPLNIYMALCMLAEVTDGNSRQQILQLLGQDNMDALREGAMDLWNTTYRNDGAVTSILANSIWLNEDISYKEETLKNLSEHYYASSFKGTMGSEAYDKALQEWLDEQTGGLLKEQAKDIKMDPSNIMTIASTVFFQSKWQNEFNPVNTKQGIFHGPSGDMTVDFMKDSSMGTYYWADSFSAVKRALDTEGNAMWFILPDQGIQVNDLLEEEQTFQLILNTNQWTNEKYVLINESIPKFDITSQMELSGGLKNLGITDVFEIGTSDFSPMADDIADIFLSKVNHDTRVAIDEEGVTAAAYTVMILCGSAMPEEEVDFTVDRPFLFVITNPNGLPLFAGIVNQPN